MTTPELTLHHAPNTRSTGALILLDRAQKGEPAAPSMSPYGDYDTILKTLTDQLGKGRWLLGERFSAADVLWGTALRCAGR